MNITTIPDSMLRQMIREAKARIAMGKRAVAAGQKEAQAMVDASRETLVFCWAESQRRKGD